MTTICFSPRECEEEDDEEKPEKRNAVKTKDIKSFFAVKRETNTAGRPTKQRKLSVTSCPLPKVLTSMLLQRAYGFI